MALSGKPGKSDLQQDVSKRLLAGISALILGSFGLHKFILGYQKEGKILLFSTLGALVLVQVYVGLFLVGGLILLGIAEGVIYLLKKDEAFISKYQVNKKPWF